MCIVEYDVLCGFVIHLSHVSKHRIRGHHIIRRRNKFEDSGNFTPAKCGVKKKNTHKILKIKEEAHFGTESNRVPTNIK